MPAQGWSASGGNTAYEDYLKQIQKLSHRPTLLSAFLFLFEAVATEKVPRLARLKRKLLDGRVAPTARPVAGNHFPLSPVAAISPRLHVAIATG